MLRRELVDAAIARAHGVSDADQAVYQQLATYCFGEAVCWPSHELLAADLGMSRLRVTRAVGRLERAGWLRKLGRRWSPRTRWMHNVYELLEAWTPISPWVSQHIVKRSERRNWGRFAARYGAVNTNRSWGVHSHPPNPRPSRPGKLPDTFDGVPGSPAPPRRRRRERRRRMRAVR